MENARKHRDIKFVTTERRKNYLVSEPNYHTTKFLTEIFLVFLLNEKNTDTYEQTCLFRTSILELSKILMYEFLYDYVKLKYYIMKNQNCVIWILCIIVYIKRDYIYKGIAKDVEATFDTSNYELDRPLPKKKIKR